MGFGSGAKKAKPQYTGIQLQTASSVMAVALYGGLTRGATNLIDYTDFKHHKQKQKNGKGFGGSTTFFTYSATPLMALGEGVISGIQRGWKDKGEEADAISAFGFTLFTGTTPQSPWGYMTTAHPAQAMGYPGTAYLAKGNLDLGQGAEIGNYSFEIEGLFFNTQVGGGGDADPALWIEALLTNAGWGAQFPAAYIDLDQLLSSVAAAAPGDATYQTYCQAMGFGINPALIDQEPSAEIVERWARLTNSAAVWTGYALKLIPYGDEVVTGNGVTFLPATAIRYALTDHDYVQFGTADPVEESLSDAADAFNTVKLEILDRANAYNPVPVTWQDQVSVETMGRREAELIEGHEICRLDMAGKVVALIGARLVNIRGSYYFTLDPRFTLLEPMDVVSLTDSGLGLDALPVRIVEIEEDEDGNLAIEAEEFPAGVSHSDGNATPGATPTTPNALAPPGPINPPILFEPPSTLAGSPQVWAAVSGGDGATYEPNWGGAFVYVSTDGTSYQAIGEVTSAARQGVTTDALPAYGGANPDTVNTVGVDLAMSNGDLTDVTSPDAAAGVTLSYLGGELLSFMDAALTGVNAYDLGGELYRGLYGTTAASHLAGVDFARLDGNIFKFDLPPAYVGVSLLFKFQSYNILGNALEDLAGCTPYPYTPTGAGFGGGAGGVPTTPTGLTATGGSQAVVLAWDAAPPADNVTGIEVYRADGLGAAFGSATKIATVTGQTWTNISLGISTPYTYFLKALNAVGASAATAGADVTTTASGVPDGVTASGAYAPLSTGEEPLVLVSDGLGQTIMVPYD